MATLEQPTAMPTAPTLEDELHQLEREEHALEVRTDGLEWRQWLGIGISSFALAVAIFAATIALSRDSHDSNGGSQPTVTPAAAQPTSAMPSGMASDDVTTTRTVSVELGEMYVKPDVDSISAGKVTFTATNVGNVVHELMVEAVPIKLDAPGKPTEDAAIAMIEVLGPGERGTVSVKLEPGKYELFCNVPGHYAAGQHTVFTVTNA